MYTFVNFDRIKLIQTHFNLEVKIFRLKNGTRWFLGLITCNLQFEASSIRSQETAKCTVLRTRATKIREFLYLKQYFSEVTTPRQNIGDRVYTYKCQGVNLTVHQCAEFSKNDTGGWKLLSVKAKKVHLLSGLVKFSPFKRASRVLRSKTWNTDIS